MPDSVSCRNALMRASRSRIARYVARVRMRKKFSRNSSRGNSANATSANWKSIDSMMQTIPVRVRTSMKMVSVPAENASLMASTSVVSRVTSRPAGVRSKKLAGSACRWANRSRRRSARLRCATSMVAWNCT